MSDKFFKIVKKTGAVMAKRTKLKSSVGYKVAEAELDQIALDLKDHGCDVKEQLRNLKKTKGEMPLAKLFKEVLNKVYEDAITPMI